MSVVKVVVKAEREAKGAREARATATNRAMAELGETAGMGGTEVQVAVGPGGHPLRSCVRVRVLRSSKVDSSCQVLEDWAGRGQVVLARTGCRKPCMDA